MKDSLTLSDFTQHVLHQIHRRNKRVHYIDLEMIVALSFIDVVQRHSEKPVDANIHAFIHNYPQSPILLDDETGIDIPALIPYYHVYGDSQIRDAGKSYIPFKQYNDVIDAWINVVANESALDIIHEFKRTPLFLVPKAYPSFIDNDKYALSDLMVIDLNQFRK